MHKDAPSATDPAELAKLTKRKLLLMAKLRDVRGRSRMSKMELVDALSAQGSSMDVIEQESSATTVIDLTDLYLLEGRTVTTGPGTVTRDESPPHPAPIARSPIEGEQGSSQPDVHRIAGDLGDSTEMPHTRPSSNPSAVERERRHGQVAVRSRYVTVGSLYQRDNAPMGLLGKSVMALISLYVVLNRLIPDSFVLPLGTSIRLYEIVLILIGLFWVLWVITDPHPMPYGAPAIAGLFLVVVVGLAPFIHAPTLNSYQANGAERGLFRMFIFVTLFLAAYHIAFRLRSGLTLLAIVIAATVGQAAFAIYEFVTERPVELLNNIATSIGMIPDPLSIRAELDGVAQRLTGEVRAAATAPHPIVLSSLVAVAALITGVWLLYARNNNGKKWLAVGAFVLLIGLPVSNSRTGFVIVLALSIPLLILLIDRLPTIITWSIPLVTAMGAAFYLSPDTPRLLLNSFISPGDDPNTVIRIERFQRLPELLEPRPYIGAGYLTHDPEIQFFDNAFNLALIELGMVGLAAILIFIGATLVRCWSGSLRADRKEAILPIAGVIGSLALLAAGATFDAWTFDQFFPTCLILLGLGLGRSAVVLRRNEQQLIPVVTRESVPA